MQTKRTIIKPFSIKQGMRNSENLQITFLISSEVSEKKFGRIFATVRESPPYLSIRSQSPTLHQIYRVTKQLQTRSWTEKPRAKKKKGKPMHKLTKNETKRKRKIKMTPCMLFSYLLKHTHKRNSYFFSKINGQHCRKNNPLTYKTCLMALRNMPNRGAIHA